MTATERKSYLRKHLSNELHRTLYAASEWHIQVITNCVIDGYHVRGYAMDSTFVHARSLFEFFTKPTPVDRHGNPRDGNYYSVDSFGIALLPSSRYSEPDGWADLLHGFVMHAQTRARTRKLKTYVGGRTKKNLNEMPVDFAMEIVRLWREMISAFNVHPDPDVQSLGRLAQKTLDTAISNAAHVMNQPLAREAGVKPIVWP